MDGGLGRCGLEENGMKDAWVLVLSQIGSIFLWCWTVIIFFGVIYEIRWPTYGTFGLGCVLLGIGGLCGWMAWWVWP